MPRRAASPIDGNRIEVELDNPTARTWLLSAINGSRKRVHFQVYMALDDDIGRPVEAALAAAGARGVTVRVLVDSLHGLHGSFGLRNPFSSGSRLGRVSSFAWGSRSRFRHRWRTSNNGTTASLSSWTGNSPCSADATCRTSTTRVLRRFPWRPQCPGARCRGSTPVYASKGPPWRHWNGRSCEAWTDAGGEPFDIPFPGAAGATTARVVVHCGLRDAHTLEAYLALIETARSHIYAVNTFPLLLEIQHALLRAIRRGVRVRTLFGNLTPRHRDGPFKGPWSAARTTATSFVHSRMDALVAAGGECYEFVVRHRPEWDAAVGDVRPHVHAKTMSADGRVCAVGSANLDITAGYWESELLLVVEDEAITRAVEAHFDELIGGSARVDRNDPEWRRRAEQRQWMRYWPGTMSA